MYGQFKRGDNKPRNEYIERVHIINHNRVVRVTKALPLDESEDEVDVINDLSEPIEHHVRNMSSS